jgi:hypothetical protein
MVVWVVLAQRWVSTWHHGPNGASSSNPCFLVIRSARHFGSYGQSRAAPLNGSAPDVP